MPKQNWHVKLDDSLAEAIRRYATGHGITNTAALSLLAARGLRDEGILITEENGKDNADT